MGVRGLAKLPPSFQHIHNLWPPTATAIKLYLFMARQIFPFPLSAKRHDFKWTSKTNKKERTKKRHERQTANRISGMWRFFLWGHRGFGHMPLTCDHHWIYRLMTCWRQGCWKWFQITYTYILYRHRLISFFCLANKCHKGDFYFNSIGNITTWRTDTHSLH